MLLIPHHLDQLAVAQERGQRLRADAAAARLRAPSKPRRALAAILRRAADRLDPGPLTWRSSTRAG
jgi:hypothetical protein